MEASKNVTEQDKSTTLSVFVSTIIISEMDLSSSYLYIFPTYLYLI